MATVSIRLLSNPCTMVIDMSVCGTAERFSTSALTAKPSECVKGAMRTSPIFNVFSFNTSAASISQPCPLPSEPALKASTMPPSAAVETTVNGAWSSPRTIAKFRVPPIDREEFTIGVFIYRASFSPPSDACRTVTAIARSGLLGFNKSISSRRPT